MKVDRFVGLSHQRLFSCLNFSHASFKVAKTAALIIFCSVVAVVGSFYNTSAMPMPWARGAVDLPYLDAPSQSPSYN